MDKIPDNETLIKLAKLSPPPQEWYDEEEKHPLKSIDCDWRHRHKIRQAAKTFLESINDDKID